MLVVRGGPITAVARGSSGEPVVLLAGRDPSGWGEEGERAVLDLGAAVLDAEELRLLRDCLERVRGGDPADAREVTTPWGGLTVLTARGAAVSGPSAADTPPEAWSVRSSRGALTTLSRSVGNNRQRDVDCTAGRGRPCHP